jgi:ABC-type dipeptide/oligopeptide/nickel transport system permease subunit
MATLDIPQFRINFPEFEDILKYPDARITFYWNMALCYIDNTESCFIGADCLQLMLELMTAHLAKIADLDAEGDVNGLAQSASVDKVSIGLTPPPLPNQTQWWLGTTNYGQELLSLMRIKSVGGFFLGGVRELSSFRKAGGVF